MTEITIDLDDILFVYNGQEYFEKSHAIAAMLADEVIWYSNGSLYANCNDIFAWATADAEEFAEKDVITMFKMYHKDRSWGIGLWVAIQRKEMPQDAVCESIKKSGLWNLEEFAKEHSLRPNFYSNYGRIVSTHKHELCNAWRATQGLEPVVYDKHWWTNGWTGFQAANPDWNTPEVQKETDRRLKEWKRESGW